MAAKANSNKKNKMERQWYERRSRAFRNGKKERELLFVSFNLKNSPMLASQGEKLSRRKATSI